MVRARHWPFVCRPQDRTPRRHTQGCEKRGARLFRPGTRLTSVSYCLVAVGGVYADFTFFAFSIARLEHLRSHQRNGLIFSSGSPRMTPRGIVRSAAFRSFSRRRQFFQLLLRPVTLSASDQNDACQRPRLPPVVSSPPSNASNTAVDFVLHIIHRSCIPRRVHRTEVASSSAITMGVANRKNGG